MLSLVFLSLKLYVYCLFLQKKSKKSKLVYRGFFRVCCKCTWFLVFNEGLRESHTTICQYSYASHAYVYPSYACMPMPCLYAPWPSTMSPMKHLTINFNLNKQICITLSYCLCQNCTLGSCMPPPPNSPHYTHICTCSPPTFLHLFCLSSFFCHKFVLGLGI